MAFICGWVIKFRRGRMFLCHFRKKIRAAEIFFSVGGKMKKSDRRRRREKIMKRSQPACFRRDKVRFGRELLEIGRGTGGRPRGRPESFARGPETPFFLLSGRIFSTPGGHNPMSAVGRVNSGKAHTSPSPWVQNRRPRSHLLGPLVWDLPELTLPFTAKADMRSHYLCRFARN